VEQIMSSMTKPMPEAADELTSALLQVPDLLLDALSLHAAKLDPSDHESHQAALAKLQSNLRDSGPDSRVLKTTDEIIQTIASYNRSIERHVLLQNKEFQAIASVLIRNFLEFCGGSQAFADELRALEGRLEQARHVKDIRSLRIELEELLQHSGATKRGPETPAAPSVEDPVTGLPGRHLAELAFQRAIETGARVHAVAFCINRMATINERYGFQHGDQILMFYSQHLAQHLSTGDQLFRWRGPCLVCLINRREDAASNAAIRRLSTTRFEHSIESNSRAVLVPVSASWIAIRLWEQESAASVREALDTFLSSHSRVSRTPSTPHKPPSTAKM
jgi:GGDEF domain-containing protein